MGTAPTTRESPVGNVAQDMPRFSDGVGPWALRMRAMVDVETPWPNAGMGGEDATGPGGSP